jgi:hypothetical protein
VEKKANKVTAIKKTATNDIEQINIEEAEKRRSKRNVDKPEPV